jgi:hypothetical protein
MPFKSQGQRRKFARLLVEGKISNQTFEEWNREAGRRKLPEHVGAKARGRTTQTAKRMRRGVREDFEPMSAVGRSRPWSVERATSPRGHRRSCSPTFPRVCSGCASQGRARRSDRGLPHHVAGCPARHLARHVRSCAPHQCRSRHWRAPQIIAAPPTTRPATVARCSFAQVCGLEFVVRAANRP